MVKRVLRFSLMVLAIGLMVTVLPIYAADVDNASYIADIVAVNSSAATTNVAAVCSINTQALIDGKYVTSDLLNTALQTQEGTDVPYMPGVSTNPWVFWVPSIGANESQPYLFYTGGPAMQTGFYYFPDSGGMTTADNDASLELGSSFTIEQKGYVDTSYVANKNLIYKQDAFRTYVGATDNITSTISASSVSPYSSTSDGFVWASNAVYNTAWTAVTGTLDNTSTSYSIGQALQAGVYYVERGFFYFDTAPIPDAATIVSATLKLSGSLDRSTTDFLITITNGQPTYPHDPLVATDYNKANYAVTSGGSLTTVGFNLAGYNNIPLNATGLTWINKTGTTKLCIRSSLDIAGTAPVAAQYDDVVVYSSEQAGTANDPQLVVVYSPETSVSVAGITPGVRKVVTSDNTTTLTLSVYDERDVLIATNSVAYAYSVPGNANDWSFITNGSMPYMEYQKIWIGGTAPANLKQHIIYERNTVFNDLTEYNNDATPTFVTTSSDPDVSATFQNFRPVSEAKCGAGITEEEPEMITAPPEEESSFFGGAESGIENLPGAAAINALLDFANIPQDLFWILAIYYLALGALLLSYHFIRSSLLWPAVVGGAVIAFFSLVCLGNPIPLWSLFIYGIRATGWLVAEKTFGW